MYSEIACDVCSMGFASVSDSLIIFLYRQATAQPSMHSSSSIFSFSRDLKPEQKSISFVSFYSSAVCE